MKNLKDILKARIQFLFSKISHKMFTRLSEGQIISTVFLKASNIIFTQTSFGPFEIWQGHGVTYLMSVDTDHLRTVKLLFPSHMM